MNNLSWSLPWYDRGGVSYGERSTPATIDDLLKPFPYTLQTRLLPVSYDDESWRHISDRK